MLQLLLSLAGLGAGIALGKIAEEELASGAKYLHLLRRAFFLLLILSLGFVFFVSQRWLLLIGMMILSLVALFLLWHEVTPVNTTVTYLCILLFSFVSSPDSYSLLASLIFLYGLPVGTLLWHTTWKAPSKRKLLHSSKG